MKKLALLLTALGLVSAAAYAEAPALRVTSVGQYIELDNTYGDGALNTVIFANEVGLAYEDWTVGLTARKNWAVDKDDNVTSDNHRLQMDIWNKINDNYKLGMRWRAQENYDRLYLRGAYNFGLVSGSADVWYEFKNAGNDDDNTEMELIPVRLNYGPFGLAYFYNQKDGTGSGDAQDVREHQIRAYANYKFGQLSTYAEYRITLGQEKQGYDYYEAGDYHKLEVGASYPLTENLSVRGYYAYEYGDTADDYKVNKKADEGNKRYGEYCLGWTYTF